MSVSELFRNDGKKHPNVLLIITDQERSLQHWPRRFYEDHLPNMCRLLKHGMEFTNYYTNACMCSPSRATLLTSQFPVQTGVTMTGSPEPKRGLPADIVNLATVFRQAGYHAEWHGKWHLGGHPSDYGFDGWQPPDAGNYLSINDTLGGGDPNNDGRFLQEILRFLDSRTDSDPPFLLVASFVNPHDVYVAQHEPDLGYTSKDFQKIYVPLPTNWTEDLITNHKPRAQAQMSLPYVTFENQPQDYVNFYAYLHTIVDNQIGQVLDALDRHGWTEDTLILRTADHGEQALSHSLVEKFFNAYEESIHIPLIVSNPIAFPKPLQTPALASHIDILPTLQGLLGLLRSNKDESGAAIADKYSPDPSSSTENKYDFVGQDLTPILDQPTIISPTLPKPVLRQSIHFTYDDIPCRSAPSIVRCIRTNRFKYAVYFTPDGKDADWELYDLIKDPLENKNVAGQASLATMRARLDEQLVQSMQHHKTLPTNFAWPPQATKYSVGVER